VIDKLKSTQEYKELHQKIYTPATAAMVEDPSDAEEEKEEGDDAVEEDNELLVSQRDALISSMRDVVRQLDRGNQIIRFMREKDKKGRFKMIADLLKLTDDGKVGSEERFQITTSARDLARLKKQDGETDEAFQARFDNAMKEVADKIFESRVKKANPDTKTTKKEKARTLSQKEQRRRIMKIAV